ncbi:glycosyltransferase family 4 protein [Arcobacter sp. LA11]|uniref:glycosyltransferase family 4 protein n=1 Tax=Arcobacter sp. LA11 TaxID=1898176 RepID=UPI00093270FA|nr:glycosyltransferase family 4 protein [Arcobacter sp. LA11]
MQKTINYKNRTKLISKLLEQEDIVELEKPSMLNKLSLKKKEFADVFFHTGQVFDKETIENIQNAKKVIVSAKIAKKELLQKVDISEKKVEIVYPAIDIKYRKPKDVREEVCEKLGIDSKKKIVFFTGRNLKSSGVVEFINMVMKLNFKNMIAVIAADKKQIYNLRFKLSKFDVDDKLLLIEDYEDINELFLASDVFVLPSYNQNFATNILKAMYCKCAVFTTANNAACEVIDIFSTMETPQDGSMQFKIDALLQNKADMKLIKKQNRKIAKQYTLDNQLLKVQNIIESI